MNVYLKNEYGEQTVRWLPLTQALKLRIYAFLRYPKSERPVVRFVL